MDSIWAALSGKKIPKKPIREGQKKAEIKLNLGKYIVARKFTEKGEYLVVTSGENTKQSYNSPQKLLDEFIGDLSFDPLEFIGMDDKEQKQLLLKLVDFKTNYKELKELEYDEYVKGEGQSPLDFLDRLRKETYDDRTIINRTLLNKKQRLEALKNIKETERVSTQELFKDIQRIKHRLEDIEKLYNKRHEIDKLQVEINNKVILAKQEIMSLTQKLNRFELEKKEAEKHFEKISNQITETEEEKNEITEKLKFLQNQVKEVDETNEMANRYEQKLILIKDYDKTKKIADSYTDKLGTIEKAKGKIVASAKMPLKEISFGEEGVLYNNIPISQIGGAEKLKVGMAIAMALNPKLRVIRISDGSLLDEENMKIVKEMAKNKDFQVWIELVKNEQGKVGFYIQDGEVINENELE